LGTGVCVVTMSSDQSVIADFGSNPPATGKPSCTLKPDSSRVSARVRIEDRVGKLERVAPRRTLKLSVRCDQTAQLTLTGKITSIPKGTRGRKRPKAKTFQIRAVTAHAPAGATVTLTVKLPAAALEGGARESVTFTLVAVNANGTSTTTAKVAQLILV